MMVIVGVLSETGVFEWSAVKAYKYSGGSTWTLITLLILFSAVVSAFLDNVTTILLLTPVTIRMCNVIGLEPTPILLAEVVFSNIGGTATAVGDPPNVIIVSSNWREVTGVEKDIDFTEFTGHLMPGIIFVMIGYASCRVSPCCISTLYGYLYSGCLFLPPSLPPSLPPLSLSLWGGGVHISSVS